jgi:hypothetical protein
MRAVWLAGVQFLSSRSGGVAMLFTSMREPDYQQNLIEETSI